ncbi:spermidine/putrescine ABC transporter substrate-binding protein PotF [Rhodospirillum rubrum]|uniref:polyamine ABC transporter substrate-binding protein n=1 Tax=Rhodospirillum rubrum TaxID=1085 RepID=UPI0019071D16|nr:polyamine ABC transporter substrate-binding protein [Rhodospirillum rubrum]MBK1664689.1 spermidine/putrescine ABC transporter substrate-binding protein PotF [Rhodospirillum rubrum]MBK1676555.1 spermidine/putrescine ABC transporter substrate-binding protein PotF [Rhodospirillum rubrum]
MPSPVLRALSGVAVALLIAGPAAAAEDKVLNVYNWSDYIAEDTLAKFQAETGIKVNYDVYDSNELLESKLLAGSSGYDIVVPTDHTLSRLIQAGIVQKLDKTKIPNLANLDPKLTARAAAYDPDNAHSVIYEWGTNGIGINVDKVRAALGPDVKLDSFDLLFKPENAEKLASCGIHVLDSAAEVFSVARNYLGLEPNSPDPKDLEKATALWMGVRPYIQKFHSSEFINALANGDICVAFGYSGDIFQAQARAEEAGNGVKIDYIIPKEGTLIWFDLMAVPVDAPHPENAHKFIDFILQPQISADISNYVWYANANSKATELLDEAVRTNPSIYPTQEVMDRLFIQKTASPEMERLRTRAWNKIKTGI